MIYYESSVFYLLCNLVRCRGSVFLTGFCIALPSAVSSVVLYLAFPEGSMSLFGGPDGIMLEAQAWGGFSFLVGFLVVFRTSQAYGRFWEGCVASYRMRTEWFDAISSVMAFTKHTNASLEEVRRFKELLVRLTSMLHAAALAELEAGADESPGDLWAYTYQIIDPAGVDFKSIETIKECPMRTELLFVWLQQLIVENIKSGILNIPAPLLSRSFHEMANGMVAFHDALRISFIPFPFPYAQACDCTLVIHWILAPLVTSQWVTSALWSCLFTFTQVFILWSLNLIATEIDHPFGTDSNDIDGCRMQDELNQQLILLISRNVERTPRLSSNWCWNEHGLDIPLNQVAILRAQDPNSRSSLEIERNDISRSGTFSPVKSRPSTMHDLFNFASAGSNRSRSNSTIRTSHHSSRPSHTSRPSSRSPKIPTGGSKSLLLNDSIGSAAYAGSQQSGLTRSGSEFNRSNSGFTSAVLDGTLCDERSSALSATGSSLGGSTFIHAFSDLRVSSSASISPAMRESHLPKTPPHKGPKLETYGRYATHDTEGDEHSGPRLRTPRMDLAAPNHEDIAPDLPGDSVVPFVCPECETTSYAVIQSENSGHCADCGEAYLACNHCSARVCRGCGGARVAIRQQQQQQQPQPVLIVCQCPDCGQNLMGYPPPLDGGRLSAAVGNGLQACSRCRAVGDTVDLLSCDNCTKNFCRACAVNCRVSSRKGTLEKRASFSDEYEVKHLIKGSSMTASMASITTGTLTSIRESDRESRVLEDY